VAQWVYKPCATSAFLLSVHPPKPEEKAMRNEATGRQRGPPLRVLVVEDYPDAGESLATLLRLYGHEVEVAKDGTTAFRMAQGTRPNVLLIDIGLPGEDGYAVAKRLRSLLRQAAADCANRLRAGEGPPAFPRRRL
jgi:PleD family two-component response regulator